MVTRANDDFYDSLAARVRRLREERGWTQEELAQAVTIEPATLSRYETARKPFPLDVLRRIAASLRVPLGQLITDAPVASAATRMADAPSYERHADLISVWRRVPAGRRKLALRILRALAGGED